MVEIGPWLAAYRHAVLAEFGARVRFIGIQGSHARGEAGEGSDIDAVLILDRLTPHDLRCYRALAAGLPHARLLCGFVAGAAELAAWDRADRLSFYFDTRPVYGTLDALLDAPTADDAARAVSLGACGLYHACCHGLLHGLDEPALRALCKQARFVLQAAQFAAGGRYAASLLELDARAAGREKEICALIRRAAQGQALAPERDAEALLCWAQELIVRYAPRAAAPSGGPG